MTDQKLEFTCFGALLSVRNCVAWTEVDLQVYNLAKRELENEMLRA